MVEFDCQACGNKKAKFKVMHAETVDHWRCPRCMRLLSLPYLVVGYQTPTQSKKLGYEVSLAYKWAIRGVAKAFGSVTNLI